MSDVSDELHTLYGFAKASGAGSAMLSRIKWIGELIDDEMIELPKSRDGKPIHVGTSYYDFDGNIWFAEDLLISETGTTLVTCSNFCDKHAKFTPDMLYGKKPDSLERIANDLEAVDCTESVKPSLKEIADRIRRLAEGEDE